MKKNIIITGAAGFLGVHFCELLANKGFNVIGKEKEKEKNLLLKKKYKKKINNIEFYNLDISNEKKIKNFRKKLSKDKIKINYLINNAAIDSAPKNIRNDKIDFPKVEQWYKEINASLIGSYLMIKYFSENMLKMNKGKIILIGSDLSVISPNPSFYKGIFKNYVKPVTYPVIKHSLVGLMKYYAVLFAKNKVNVNMVSPSPIFRQQKPKFLKKIKEVIPMKNIANKKDLNSSILYLLDDNNNFITGQNIIVDGGRTIV